MVGKIPPRHGGILGEEILACGCDFHARLNFVDFGGFSFAPGQSGPPLMLPRQVRGVCGSDETGSLQLIIEGKLSPRHGESLGEANFV